MNTGYLGNQNLKKSSIPIEWTTEMLKEFANVQKILFTLLRTT
jgi:hypothetical protein